MLKSFTCYLTGKVIDDPVFLTSGNTYEREAILKHFRETGATDPKTGEAVDPKIVIENINFKSLLNQFRATNPEIDHFLCRQKEPEVLQKDVIKIKRKLDSKKSKKRLLYEQKLKSYPRYRYRKILQERLIEFNLSCP